MDGIYLLALPKGVIPDVDTLLVTDLPAQITCNGSLWHIDYNDYYQRHFASLTHTESADFSLTTLSDVLKKTLLISQFAVLVLQDYIFAIINSVGSYYLFDSHSRNSSELPIENGGTVAMLQFSNNINLLNHITHLPQTLYVEKFEIVPITMTCTTEQIPPIIKIIFNQNNVMSSKPIQSDTGILLHTPGWIGLKFDIFDLMFNEILVINMHNSQLVYNFYEQAIKSFSLRFTCFMRFLILLLL